MNLEKIYIELSRKEKDDYYIELAQREVLVVPLLVEFMLDNQDTSSRWAQNLLEKISETKPMTVYPYFDYISTVFEKNKGINAWNCWRIIANILPVDISGYWDTIREKYILALSSDMITEFLIALSVADKIIDAKSADREIILSTIQKSRVKNYTVCGEISESSRKIADEAVNSFFERLE